MDKIDLSDEETGSIRIELLDGNSCTYFDEAHQVFLTDGLEATEVETVLVWNDSTGEYEDHNLVKCNSNKVS